jgi:hypothetical protein
MSLNNLPTLYVGSTSRRSFNPDVGEYLVLLDTFKWRYSQLANRNSQIGAIDNFTKEIFRSFNVMKRVFLDDGTYHDETLSSSNASHFQIVRMKVSNALHHNKKPANNNKNDSGVMSETIGRDKAKRAIVIDILEDQGNDFKESKEDNVSEKNNSGVTSETIGRDKAKRSIVIDLLEDQGNNFKEITNSMTSRNKKKDVSASIDVPSMQVTIKMLKEAGQDKEANEMLKAVAKYQMNNIRKAMPLKTYDYDESVSDDSDE